MFGEDAQLHIKGINIDWDKISRGSYLSDTPSIAEVNSIMFHKPVTFFVGENGSGKSTLLEAIRLIKGIHKPGWGYFLRAESFYNVALAEAEYSQYGGRPQHFHEKSHGESFLSMAQNNFKGNGIYLLDEPEAALSPQRQLALLLEIVRCAGDMSQFIIVTHSPILLGIPGAEILSFDGGEIHPCTYEETDSYQVTEMFINNREQILKRLLES
ncbi:MAG: AAA family ATPase [Lachnospiraceae bacterium]|nr:AAA family ATPase [Lachnospiraceae bacterium]